MLYLPAMVSMALFAANGADRLAALGGKETILVVDDNVAVRQVACRSLRRIGCHVLKASSGEEALAVGVTSEVRIDLLLTDLIMPGSLNGRQLVQQLRAHRPELPVFFSSGYAADVLGRDFVATDRERWLAKPYNPMLLARAVRGALDGEDLDH